MEHDNTDRGAIWPNKDKKTDKHPDFTGRLNVGGVEYWVSAWKRKEGDNPRGPSLRFAITPKDEADKRGIEQARQAASAPQSDPFEDIDVPF